MSYITKFIHFLKCVYL